MLILYLFKVSRRHFCTNTCIRYRRCFKMFLSFCLPVLQPTVMIRRSHSGLVYAGSEFTLNAEISLNNSAVVDVSILLTISWSRDGDIITSNDHITISNDIVIVKVATQPPSPTHLLPPLIVV